jgi:hypothetical protein
MEVLGEKHVPVLLSPALTWDRTHASSMRTVYIILVRKPEGKMPL